MQDKPTDLIIIDDPAAPEELRRAIVNAGSGVAVRPLTTAELATIGPLEVRAVDMGRAMVDLEHGREPAPPPPPDRFHIEAEISAAELRGLQTVLATLKPRTNVAKAAIAALQRITKSKVAL